MTATIETTEMRVTANRDELLWAIDHCAKIANPRFKAVLGCVHLECVSDRLVARATNLEMSVRIECTTVQTESAGAICVNAEKFLGCVKSIRGDLVSLQVKGDHLLVKGEDRQFKLYGLPVADFPPESPAFEGDGFNMDAAEFSRVITQSAFAAKTEHSRYAINGVCIYSSPEIIRFAATDMHVLAVADAFPGTQKPKGKKEPVIPTEAIRLAARLVGEESETVEITAAENIASFTVGNATITTNLIEGTFPPFATEVDIPRNKKLLVSREDFIEAVRAASAFTTPERTGVKFLLSKQGAQISSASPAEGESEINYPCKYDGEDIAIGFNPKFLLLALIAANTPEVTIEFAEQAGRCAIVRGGGNYLCCVQPVNI